jgi:hypothetical protein
MSITLVAGVFIAPTINKNEDGHYRLTYEIEVVRAQGRDEDPCADNPQACAEAPPTPRAGAPLRQEASWSLSGLIIGVTGVFLWIGMQIFDAAVNMFVIGMGGLVNNNFSGAINSVWVVVRDLVNLTFIFGLVYVGFRTILDADMGGTKRMLAQIIIGALLVNFSLFITKVVIDVSNVTAIQIYKAMNLTAEGSSSNISISSAFMNHMGLVSLYNAANARGELTVRMKAQNPDGEAYLPFIVGGSIFILVAAFVFAAGGILLIIRFGVLLILMILSPIAFAAQVFPKVAGWSQMWRDKLFAQAFFAPAYFFMIFITLKVATSYQTSMQSFDNIYSVQSQVFTSGFQTAAYFALTIVLMISSIIVAKQMGAVGAARVSAIGKTIRTNIQSTIGRNSIGFLAQGGAAINDGLEKTRTGRNVKRLVSAVSLGTFDERSRRKVFEAGKKAKFGGQYSREDDKTWKENRERAIKLQDKKNEQQAAINQGIAMAEQHINAGTAPTGDDKTAIDNLTKAIKDLSDKSLEEMKVDVLSNEQVAINLSSKQIEVLEKSDKFTPQDIEKIKNARKKAVTEAVSGGAASVRGYHNPQKIAARGETELAKMPVDALIHPNMAPHLTPNVVETLIKDGKLDTNQLAAIKTNIENESARLNALGPANPYKQKFQQWTNRSTYGAGMGLNL